MYPQCYFYFDLLTFQIKRSAIIEELFGQLILKASNIMTKLWYSHSMVRRNWCIISTARLVNKIQIMCNLFAYPLVTISATYRAKKYENYQIFQCFHYLFNYCDSAGILKKVTRRKQAKKFHYLNQSVSPWSAPGNAFAGAGEGVTCPWKCSNRTNEYHSSLKKKCYICLESE